MNSSYSVDMFRITKQCLTKPMALLCLLYVVVVVGLLSLYRANLPSSILLMPNIKVSTWPYQPVSCWDRYSSGEGRSESCLIDSNDGTIFLLGDSHAQQLVFGFEAWKDHAVEGAAKSTLLLSSTLMRGNWRAPSFVDSAEVNYIKSVLAQSTANDVVVFAVTSGHLAESVFGAVTNPGGLHSDLVRLINSIMYSDPIQAKVVFMLDTPRLEHDVSRHCLAPRAELNEICQLQYEDYQKQHQRLLQVFQNLGQGEGKGESSPLIVDPTSVFCSGGECSLFDEGVFILIDSNHIRTSVSERLVKEVFVDVLS